MIKYFRYQLFIFLSLLAFISCREEEAVTISPAVNLSGYVQKGPFINGTTLIITELDDSLAATGKTFTTQITDNKGTFSIKTSQLDFHNLQLIATGFYFDEVKGEKSAAQLTLFALANVSEAGQINVNVLSHLEKERVIYLINQGKSFAEAKKQAQREILAIFRIEKEDIANAETLDISQEGEDNAILLAISAILQGDNTVAELSELLADITSDIREDGKLDSDKLKVELKANATALNLNKVRQYVQNRYTELGVEASIPAFEQYIDSDGDGILNKEEDDTPDEFVFATQENVAINTKIISNETTISGISKDGFSTAVVQNGKIIKNGSVLSDTLVNLVNGDKIKLELTSSFGYNTSVTASLKLGSIEKQFIVTTDAYIPEEFSFTTIKSAVKNTVYTSNTVTISGLRHPAPSTINNGTLIRNGVEQTEDSITVVNGDQIAIKVTSHPDWQNRISAELKIGSIDKTFEVINKNNLWTRKSNFPGKGYFGQICFAIDNKIYVGLGYEISEFYEYDPSKDKWTKKADFPGNQRLDAVYFSINTKGYVGLGTDSQQNFKDFWEYDHVADQWTRIGDFPGAARSLSSCFIINNHAFIGLGTNSSWNTTYKDFWEFDPINKKWTRKPDFPGAARYRANNFSLENKGYFLNGISRNQDQFNDVWEFDPQTNKWTKRSNFPNVRDASGISFTINNEAFIGTADPRMNIYGSIYMYDKINDKWIPLEGLEIETVSACTVANGKAYYFRNNETWEYTP